MSTSQRVIIVGGGLAGLAASVRIAEAGVPVDLFSMVPVKRSHSVCAQGGINACNEVARQQGYSEYQHFDETIYGGDFLADQGPVLEMCNWAPKIINLLDRMGVPFNRTSEGRHDLRLFGGSLFKRTHFSGATTGQQLLYALDEQTRRYESEGKISKYEFWEFLAPIIVGEGAERRCVGIVAQDMRTMQIRSFRGDAVVMATGGCGLIFGKSTNSVICTGGAASRCYQAGAWYANGEMIQVHPTAIPGADKCRLMSESARGEGGRVWVPRQKGDKRAARQIPDSERWYFLEEKYPAYGNLVPRDIATREIFDVCVNMGMGIDGGNMVYLDLTHKDPEYLTEKLGGIMEIYEKFVGVDPRHEPMKIFPSVHYSMGGMWTTFTPGSYQPSQPAGGHKSGSKPPIGTEVGVGMTFGAANNMMTNIRGLYAFGEVNFAYHGATRLGANALLSCIFDGLYNGVSVVNYIQQDVPSQHPAEKMKAEVFEAGVACERAKVDRLLGTVDKGSGDPAFNPYVIAREMGDEMTAASTVVKTGPRLQQCLSKLGELKERYRQVRLGDAAGWTNQTLSFTRAVGDMLILAEVIARCGLLREESRGSHKRLDFPERDDARFLKTSVAEFVPGTGEPRIFWRDVQTSLVKLRARTYGKVESGEGRKQPEAAASAS
ncbi:MAG: succinate dehydrogenase flavoprotein subunit [Leptolyngbya sp. PLA3]|nr:MAG: succinate dehydrogenase flavoprotein subunit [Cyanobacteria bacterium CYA]MCE7969473.1 succinate dehydrogenase flavoprotein subunit [Leptolyngbya sp. PL-A3]